MNEYEFKRLETITCLVNSGTVTPSLTTIDTQAELGQDAHYLINSIAVDYGHGHVRNYDYDFLRQVWTNAPANNETQKGLNYDGIRDGIRDFAPNALIPAKPDQSTLEIMGLSLPEPTQNVTVKVFLVVCIFVK